MISLPQPQRKSESFRCTFSPNLSMELHSGIISIFLSFQPVHSYTLLPLLLAPPLRSFIFSVFPLLMPSHTPPPPSTLPSSRSVRWKRLSIRRPSFREANLKRGKLKQKGKQERKTVEQFPQCDSQGPKRSKERRMERK